MRKTLAFALPVAFVVISLILAPWKGSSGENYPQAPDFRLKDIKGNEVSLSDYKGKILFLNFWATWCPPCRAEIPDFVETYQEMKNKGMEILGISLDRLSPSSILSFMEKFKINYPVVMGTQKIVEDYQPGQYIPTTIIIDRQGRIRHKQVGAMSKETLVDYFNKLSQ